tara:strand:- start:3089 stop:3793 length:705 start_codon:yes stop_codon:yes gene_type:complete
MKVLVIEDNPILSARMKQQLQKTHLVETALTGNEGVELAKNTLFDIILLDLGLPDTDGKDVCKLIRSHSAGVPILVISGTSNIDTRVELLDIGADDYIVKPFVPSELEARMNALSRRKARNDSVTFLQVGPLKLWPSSRKVERSGVEITLRKKEFDILECLMRNKGRIMSREMIILHAWSANSKSWVGSVDVHIKQLRDKVDRPFNERLIKTSYGIGYMVDIPKVTKVTKGATA